MEGNHIYAASPKHYGSMSCTGTNACPVCPTCRGTGRIPRGHSDMLVAVIPCNDVRLKPRRTKLYVCISMAICLLICCLILFFLFPRSLAAVAGTLQSVMVYLGDDTIDVEVTKTINITNDNFVPVEILELSVQGLVTESVVGKAKYLNLTRVKSRSQNLYTVKLHLSIKDKELCNFCKTRNVHLFLLYQITMKISYISHTEQVSITDFDYFDCAHNRTKPRPSWGEPGS